MDDRARQNRWLLILRLATLAVALYLLPSLAPIPEREAFWLSGWVLALLLLWSVPLWKAVAGRDRLVGGLDLVEAVLIAGLVASYGQLASPFALLYLPMLSQAAAFLSPAGYALVAGYVVAGYGLAIFNDLGLLTVGGIAPLYFPVWAPLWAAGGLLMLTGLGLLGHWVREEHERARGTIRRLKRYRTLVERMPRAGEEEAFWRRFLHDIARSGGFTDGAVVRFVGARPEIIATDRHAAWEGLVKRQHALFEHAILKAGRPEVLVEEQERGKPRAIVCWPVPHRHGGPEAAGALCFLVPRAIDLKTAERRLKPWLPLAAMLLAVSEPRLTLQRAKVDWRVLTNVTLHRLHQRLKPYLVLVHVDPGAVEADALLLADAIAHAIEDAIDRAPPGTQVRVSVRRAAGGWAFQVEATAPA
ncbi:MAG: hypothetical protein ACLGIN_07810, partial [Candidatus Sericytochromatia bacterium]